MAYVNPNPGKGPGAIADQDALTDGQGAVVPDQQEVQDSINKPTHKDHTNILENSIEKQSWM